MKKTDVLKYAIHRFSLLHFSMHGFANRHHSDGGQTKDHCLGSLKLKSWILFYFFFTFRVNNF